jgi:environmental stress-induced protein Ves
MQLHTFQRSHLVATPWKNGGGQTREIVCQPPGAGMDRFDWRASIAHIASDGPFSRFEGVDRVITLLEGAGVHLRTADGRIDHRLAQPWMPFAFEGEAPVSADLLGADCHDFNVMSRRSRCSAQVQVCRGDTTLAAAPEGLLFALGGSWRVSPTEPLCDAVALAADSGLWWSQGETALRLQAEPADEPVALLAVCIHRKTP